MDEKFPVLDVSSMLLKLNVQNPFYSSAYLPILENKSGKIICRTPLIEKTGTGSLREGVIGADFQRKDYFE